MSEVIVCVCVVIFIFAIIVSYYIGQSANVRYNPDQVKKLYKKYSRNSSSSSSSSYNPSSQNDENYSNISNTNDNSIPSYYREENIKNPVLNYQRQASRGRDPATLGDPIIPKVNIGPSRSLYQAYDNFSGPYPGKSLNVPVPQGSLKMSSEKWKYPFYYQQKPLAPYDYFKPYGPNAESMQASLSGGFADNPYYTNGGTYPYAVGYTGDGSIPFIGSVDAYAPFAEVTTPWEKTGILTSDGDRIMSLYRQPIAPLQNIFKYMVQDKDGFMIPLNETYLENNDIISHIPGKSGIWKVHIYVNNKYIWV
jgi:hypothetical protein